MNTYCQNCGAVVAPNANFCGNCGARQAQTAAAAPVSGPAGAAPSSQETTPAPFGPEAGIEKEPMLLLDVTGSMNYRTSADDATPRRDTIKEAIGTIVATLAAEDSQAEHEEGGGGLRTVIFAGGQARHRRSESQ